MNAWHSLEGSDQQAAQPGAEKVLEEPLIQRSDQGVGGLISHVSA